MTAFNKSASQRTEIRANIITTMGSRQEVEPFYQSRTQLSF